MDPLAVGINKLTLRAGDVVVVRTVDRLTMDEGNHLRAGLEAALPTGVTALLLTAGADLTVLRDGTAVEPVADTPTVVGG